MKPQGKSLIKNIILHPIFILFIFNLIFFTKPIAKGLYISPADTLQRLPSFNLGEFHRPQNSLLFDAVTQFQPWYIYARNTVRSGHLPVWNPQNGAGVPFLANNISALLFPLSIYFYIIDIRVALIMFYFSKLFLIGLFTYLFLMELGLKKYSSLAGAVAFNFAGFNIVWLLWPQTNVIIFLPLFLLLIEKLLNKSLPLNKFYLFFSLSLFLSFTAGHPETLFQVLVITTCYFAFQIFIRNLSSSRKTINIKYALLGLFTGVLLSGVVTLPFLEYLLNSYTLVSRAYYVSNVLLPLKAFIYTLFPNLSGNPSTDFYHPLVNSNYNELTGAYAGTIILLLTFISIFLMKKNKRIVFFAVSSLAIFPFIYNLPLINKIVLPVNSIVANTRLLFYLAFSQSVLAAFALDNLTWLKKYRRYVLWGLIILILFIPLSYFILDNLPGKLNNQFNPLKLGGFISYLMFHAIYLLTTTVIGAGAIYLIREKGKYSNILFLIIVFTVFAQTGFINMGYIPAIEEKYFYPVSQDINKLKSLPDGRYIELGGDMILPADTNLAFGLQNVENYDALDINSYRTKFNKEFNLDTNRNSILTAEPESLNVFGVRYVLSYADLDKKIFFDKSDPSGYYPEPSGEVLYEQMFEAQDNNLTAVRVLPANFNRKNNCDFEVSLYNNAAQNVFTKKYRCGDVSDKVYFQMNFPQVQNSKGKIFKISIKELNARPGDSISFWHDSEGSLIIDSLYNEIGNANLKLISSGKFNIYENRGVYKEYYPIDSPPDTDGAVKITDSGSLYKRFNVTAMKEVEIASTNAYYPGWKVYIDGKLGKINRFSDAFQEISVPKGNHIVEVVYKPLSIYYGAGMSLAGFILLIYLYAKKKYI